MAGNPQVSQTKDQLIKYRISFRGYLQGIDNVYQLSGI